MRVFPFNEKGVSEDEFANTVLKMDVLPQHKSSDTYGEFTEFKNHYGQVIGKKYEENGHYDGDTPIREPQYMVMGEHMSMVYDYRKKLRETTVSANIKLIGSDINPRLKGMTANISDWFTQVSPIQIKNVLAKGLDNPEFIQDVIRYISNGGDKEDNAYIKIILDHVDSYPDVELRVSIDKENVLNWLKAHRPNDVEFVTSDKDLGYVQATLIPDDDLSGVEFNAAHWLAHATAKEIQDLADTGFQRSRAADILAYFAEENGTLEEINNVKNVFSEMADQHDQDENAGGFEVEVDEEQAIAWLEQHRPEVAAIISSNAPR